MSNTIIVLNVLFIFITTFSKELEFLITRIACERVAEHAQFGGITTENEQGYQRYGETTHRHKRIGWDGDFHYITPISEDQIFVNALCLMGDDIVGNCIIKINKEITEKEQYTKQMMINSEWDWGDCSESTLFVGEKISDECSPYNITSDIAQLTRIWHICLTQHENALSDCEVLFRNKVIPYNMIDGYYYLDETEVNVHEIAWISIESYHPKPRELDYLIVILPIKLIRGYTRAEALRSRDADFDMQLIPDLFGSTRRVIKAETQQLNKYYILKVNKNILRDERYASNLKVYVKGEDESRQYPDLEALNNAIQECIAAHISVDYLQRRGYSRGYVKGENCDCFIDFSAAKVIPMEYIESWYPLTDSDKRFSFESNGIYQMLVNEKDIKWKPMDELEFPNRELDYLIGTLPIRFMSAYLVGRAESLNAEQFETEQYHLKLIPAVDGSKKRVFMSDKKSDHAFLVKINKAILRDEEFTSNMIIPAVPVFALPQYFSTNNAERYAMAQKQWDDDWDLEEGEQVPHDQDLDKLDQAIRDCITTDMVQRSDCFRRSRADVYVIESCACRIFFWNAIPMRYVEGWYRVTEDDKPNALRHRDVLSRHVIIDVDRIEWNPLGARTRRLLDD